MSGIHKDGLIERESDVVSVEGGVGRGVEGSQRRLSQTSDELLDVANALRSSGGATWTIAVPKGEI